MGGGGGGFFTPYAGRKNFDMLQEDYPGREYTEAFQCGMHACSSPYLNNPPRECTKSLA